MKKSSFTLPVLLLFLISGAGSLIYQIVWVRMFGQVFGNTLSASTTVIAACMGGLSVGSYVSGAFLAQRGEGLRFYACVELIAGIFGILMPLSITCISGMYAWIYQSCAPSLGVLTGIRFVFSFGVVFVPALFMGATFPLLSSYLAGNSPGPRSMTYAANLYGIHTLGALIGCFTAGYYLMRTFGIVETNAIAAACNIAAAAGATLLCFLSPRSRITSWKDAGIAENKSPLKKRVHRPPHEIPGRVILILCAVSGFAGLSLEIAWIKALGRIFPVVWAYSMDSYAVTAVLGVLLGGIGLGSLFISRLLHRIRRVWRVLCFVQCILGITAFLSIHIIQNPVTAKNILISFVNFRAVSWLFSGPIAIFGAHVVMQMLMAAAIIFVPAVMMGISFPLYTALYMTQKQTVGKSVGAAYAANTMGGILGTLSAGFILIPVFGLFPALGLFAALYAIAAVVLWYFSPERAPIKSAGAVAAFCIVFLLIITTKFDYSRFLASVIHYGTTDGSSNVVYFKEHADGAIHVVKSDTSGYEMYNDGVIVAASQGQNLFSHIFPAHLISLLMEEPGEALVIGFGCGITGGSMALYDEVDRITGVEMNRGIVDPAVTYFSDANNSVFANKKLSLVIQDGKNFVRMTGKRFKVIYACPSLPQSGQGSAGLFTREFFADCRKRLAPGGFQCVWLPLHLYSPHDYLAIVKTFITVYPHAVLWHPALTETAAGLSYLVGSDHAMIPDYRALEEKLARPAIARDIARLDEGAFATAGEFITQFAMGAETLKRITAGITLLNTDNRPIVEYYAHDADLIQSAVMSKIALIELLGTHSENPLHYTRNMPWPQDDTFRQRAAALRSSKQYLLMGHAMRAYRGVLDVKGVRRNDVDSLIVSYYSSACRYTPDNAFLKRFFNH